MATISIERLAPAMAAELTLAKEKANVSLLCV